MKQSPQLNLINATYTRIRIPINRSIFMIQLSMWNQFQYKNEKNWKCHRPFSCTKGNKKGTIRTRRGLLIRFKPVSHQIYYGWTITISDHVQETVIQQTYMAGISFNWMSWQNLVVLFFITLTTWIPQSYERCWKIVNINWLYLLPTYIFV